MDVASRFQRRLRELMEQNKATQQAVASAIGIKRQSVAQYLDGQTLPVVDKLDALAEYFGVSADYLLGRTDVKSPDDSIRAICAKTHLAEDTVKRLSDAVSMREVRCRVTVESGITEGRETMEITDFGILDFGRFIDEIRPLFDRGSHEYHMLLEVRKRWLSNADHNDNSFRWTMDEGFVNLPFTDALNFYASQFAKRIEGQLNMWGDAHHEAREQ